MREWLNGGLFPLSFMLAMILFVFMVNTYRLVGPGWTQASGVTTACTLFWIFAADAFRAGFVWFSLRVLNDGGTMPAWMDTLASVGFVVTAFVLIAAMIRCIYQFTPQRLGHSYWILSVSLTIAFLIISHVAPPFPI